MPCAVFVRPARRAAAGRRRGAPEANFARAQVASGAGDLDYPAILEAETAKYQAEMDEYDPDMRGLKPILDLDECDELGLQE